MPTRPVDGSESQAVDSEVEQTSVRRSERKLPPPSGLEIKLAHARFAIARMAPHDPRARLLQVAMLRRDEILLEALLRRLDAIPPR